MYMLAAARVAAALCAWGLSGAEAPAEMGAGVSSPKDVQYSVVVPNAETWADRTVPRRHYSALNRLADNFSAHPVKNAWELFQMGVNTSAEDPCLGTRVVTPDGNKGEYVWKTYREVERLALEVGSGLLNGDFVPSRRFEEPGEQPLSLRCIGIFARNREEWVITEHAANAYGLTVVPLYDTLGAHSTRFILGETQMKTVVCDADCLVKLLAALQQDKQHRTVNQQPQQPHGEEAQQQQQHGGMHVEQHRDIFLECVITLDRVTDEQRQTAEELGLRLMCWEELLELGRANMVPLSEEVQPTLDSLHTICYTSGTTGSPKGVMMSHGNFVAAIAAAVEGPLQEFGLQLFASDCIISYLPLAHVYERFCENLLFSYGARVGFYSGDPHKLLEDVQVLKPTVFCSVPRLFQRIEERVLSTLQGKSFVARSLFQQALTAKIRRLRSSGIPHHPVWDRIVFDKFKDLMGGRVRIMLTGSAPLDPHTLERMRAFFCCWIVEGYGMTETMGASFLTWNVYDRNPGQVGGVLPSLEFCLLDVSETMSKYSIRDPIPKGELCVRGPTVFAGYFRNKTETEKAMDKDGWFRTGDVVALLPNGGVQIIDRKKNIFKLAQGEYVAPEKIEAVYLHSRFVAQCFVFGFSSETSLVAVVVADPDQTLQWVRETRGAAAAEAHTFAEWLEDPEVQRVIQEDMQQVAKKQGLKGFELARKVYFRAEQFTVENGLLTPTFKLKRHYAQEVFATEIKEMYDKLHKEQQRG